MLTEDLAKRLAQLPPEKRKLLEQKLREKNLGRERVKQAVIKRRGSRDPSPLSFAQWRLWFLHQLEPDSQAYTIPHVMYFSGPLDVRALEAGLAGILARHEILHSTFPTENGGPVLRLSQPPPVALKPIDLSGLEGQAKEDEAERVLLEVARRPFDLATGPLIRFCLLRIGDNEHRLLIAWHHIITDGWSLDLLERELAAFYNAALKGRAPPLPDLPIQYTDYALWQQERLGEEAIAKELSYWEERLRGAPELLALPADRPRPLSQRYRGGRYNCAIPEVLVKRLEALGRQDDATLFMVLMAAFQILLHRLSGQSDICTGFPIAGRNMIETEDVIGLFANTLVLRSQLVGEAGFREVLRQVRKLVQDAYEHQELPFEKLVEVLQPERHLSHSPIFQVLLIYQNQPKTPPAFDGLTLRREVIDIGSSMFDLSLFVRRTDDGATLGFLYDIDLFEPATVARWAGHFESLLEGILANSDRRISALPLLSNAERAKLLYEWNATEAAYPCEACLHELIQAQAAATPEKTAVIFEDGAISYGDLDRDSNRLARHLRGLGVGPGRLVGICLERSAAMVTGLLAILKAGGAYVPIDPAFPRDRQAFMLEDAEISVLVTETGLLEELPLDGITLVRLDADAVSIEAESPDALSDTGATAESLAYVIYTSGSTGRPKGVRLTHRAVVNFLASMRERPGLTADDSLVAVTTLSFDIAGLELYLPLLEGACVIIASRAVAMDGEALAAQLATSGATIMQATPATWRLLIESGWPGDPNLKILCGGEALPRDLAEQLLDRCGELWNMYGPTETTIWSAVHRVATGPGPVPVGRPIANTDIYVLDAQLEPVPIGVAGEVFIGGAGVAQGYWKRPELTAERFVPHPFSEQSEARLYRTGDLGRFLASGELEVLGRLDHQVKLRGFRIELGEIEVGLAAHDQVQEAVVVLAGEGIDQRLVAYLVPSGDNAPMAKDLRAFLKERLPDYMVPTAYITLPALPMTPNGKIDRKALPTPDGAQSELTGADYAAPQTPIEQALAAIWSEVLGIEQIGRNDNFFELGGHSFLAVRIFATIEERLGTRLPLATLFERATIGELAGALADSAPSESWSSLVAIQAGDSRPPLFCARPVMAVPLSLR